MSDKMLRDKQMAGELDPLKYKLFHLKLLIKDIRNERRWRGPQTAYNAEYEDACAEVAELGKQVAMIRFRYREGSVNYSQKITSPEDIAKAMETIRLLPPGHEVIIRPVNG